MAEISYILIEDDDDDDDVTIDKDAGDGDRSGGAVATLNSTSLRCDNFEEFSGQVPDLNLPPPEFQWSTIFNQGNHRSSCSGNVSNPNSSVTCIDFFDPSNKVNCTMDLFPIRVEESCSGPNLNPNCGLIAKNDSIGQNNSELDFGLGFPIHSGIVDDDYEGFIEPSRRFGTLFESGQSVELREQIFYMDGVPIVEPKSDDRVIRMDDQVIRIEDGDNSPICLDLFLFGDARDSNNNQDDRDVNVNAQPQEVILVDVDNVEGNIEVQYAEGDDEDVDEDEYEPYIGPASKAVVENLDSVLVTKEEFENNNSLCSICKEEINVGEMAKQLPCFHRYHGDCIIPWLGMRHTCPICRYELPTDDPEYEQRRNLRAGQQQ